ncbi:MAG: hypothetical protein QOJ07_1631 [Thermoleophilaceae bacterium]|jgi:hypothetical protein|nr:hypothetical protein [Thermoleophilaceae bacterium]
MGRGARLEDDGRRGGGGHGEPQKNAAPANRGGYTAGYGAGTPGGLVVPYLNAEGFCVFCWTPRN